MNGFFSMSAALGDKELSFALVETHASLIQKNKIKKRNIQMAVSQFSMSQLLLWMILVPKLHSNEVMTTCKRNKPGTPVSHALGRGSFDCGLFHFALPPFLLRFFPL